MKYKMSRQPILFQTTSVLLIIFVIFSKGTYLSLIFDYSFFFFVSFSDAINEIYVIRFHKFAKVI